jgi:ABC-type nitrate/sulfonate/bicarbonate transport system substrate-binding protein
VALEGLDVPPLEFLVDHYGAPRYPELILTTSAETLRTKPELVDAVRAATAHGYEDLETLGDEGLEPLLDAVPELDPDDQAAQFEALQAANALAGNPSLDRTVLDDWAQWDREHGILTRPLDVDAAFPLLQSGDDDA